MPRVTEGNAKEDLFSAVRRYTELTGEQIGMVFTSKGNITVIGKEPFKEFVNRHRREVQASLTASYSSINTTPNEPTPPFLQDTNDTELLDLFNSTVDPNGLLWKSYANFSPGTGLRRFVLGGSWWDKSINFHNMKSGYTKDELIRLIRCYRRQQVPSTVIPDSRT